MANQLNADGAAGFPSSFPARSLKDLPITSVYAGFTRENFSAGIISLLLSLK